LEYKLSLSAYSEESDHRKPILGVKVVKVKLGEGGTKMGRIRKNWEKLGHETRKNLSILKMRTRKNWEKLIKSMKNLKNLGLKWDENFLPILLDDFIHYSRRLSTGPYTL
jgi:hypothetical protein